MSRIKVFIRIRPCNKPSETIHISDEDENSTSIKDFEGKGNIRFENHDANNSSFSFDGLFGMNTKQKSVFEMSAEPVLKDILRGINGTIFAFGQTNSGKTYTITGGSEKYEDRGLIPRVIEFLFKEGRMQIGKTFGEIVEVVEQLEIDISYLEIYNEKGYDLLIEHGSTELSSYPAVFIQRAQGGKVVLRNLSAHRATSEEQALDLLFLGDTNRVIAETPMNDASSRSHTVFIIQVALTNADRRSVISSRLYLVDLAGSERISKTGIKGTLQRESRHINLSLHYLEHCIIAIKKHSKHVPFRNSMMTSVLQDSLGGNCKTVMIGTVTADIKNIDETLSTCRFGARVGSIENHAVVNKIEDASKIVKNLRAQIQALKAKVEVGSVHVDYTEEEQESIKASVVEYTHNKNLNEPFIFAPDVRHVCSISHVQATIKEFRNYLIELVKIAAENSNTRQSGRANQVDDYNSENMNEIKYSEKDRNSLDKPMNNKSLRLSNSQHSNSYNTSMNNRINHTKESSSLNSDIRKTRNTSLESRNRKVTTKNKFKISLEDNDQSSIKRNSSRHKATKNIQQESDISETKARRIRAGSKNKYNSESSISTINMKYDKNASLQNRKDYNLKMCLEQRPYTKSSMSSSISGYKNNSLTKKKYDKSSSKQRLSSSKNKNRLYNLQEDDRSEKYHKTVSQNQIYTRNRESSRDPNINRHIQRKSRLTELSNSRLHNKKQLRHKSSKDKSMSEFNHKGHSSRKKSYKIHNQINSVSTNSSRNKKHTSTKYTSIQTNTKDIAQWRERCDSIFNNLLNKPSTSYGKCKLQLKSLCAHVKSCGEEGIKTRNDLENIKNDLSKIKTRQLLTGEASSENELITKLQETKKKYENILNELNEKKKLIERLQTTALGYHNRAIKILDSRWPKFITYIQRDFNNLDFDLDLTLHRLLQKNLDILE